MTPGPTALVVEDDALQRFLAAETFEDSNIHVIQCESGEAAQAVLEYAGESLCMIFTDVNLAGPMTGAELANLASAKFPNIRVVVTSGNSKPELPPGAKFIQKPWTPPELLKEARDACLMKAGPEKR